MQQLKATKKPFRESTKRLSEVQHSLASSESHAALQSETAKGKQIEYTSLQRTNSTLAAHKCSLEHKVAQLEATCAALKDRLREKISKEEKRMSHEKEAYRRLRNASKADQSTRSMPSFATPLAWLNACRCQRRHASWPRLPILREEDSRTAMRSRSPP